MKSMCKQCTYYPLYSGYCSKSDMVISSMFVECCAAFKRATKVCEGCNNTIYKEYVDGYVKFICGECGYESFN